MYGVLVKCNISTQNPVESVPSLFQYTKQRMNRRGILNEIFIRPSCVGLHPELARTRTLSRPNNMIIETINTKLGIT